MQPTDVKSTMFEEEKEPPVISNKRSKNTLDLDRVKIRCKSEATSDEYVRINKNFNKWLDANFKGTIEVRQEHIEEYIKMYLD